MLEPSRNFISSFNARIFFLGLEFCIALACWFDLHLYLKLVHLCAESDISLTWISRIKNKPIYERDYNHILRKCPDFETQLERIQSPNVRARHHTIDYDHHDGYRIYNRDGFMYSRYHDLCVASREEIH